MLKRSVFVLIAMLGLAACASSSGSRSSTQQDVITAEEIERTMVADLYELDGPTATVKLPGLTTRNVEGAIVINPTN